MLPDLSRLGAWADLPFFTEDYPQIAKALAAETRRVLPPAHQTFAALELTQPQDVRVVILGQDPYPTAGHAMGLAFSVTRETKLPASLRNIFKELAEDIGSAPKNGDLTHWAKQGVLLLNTCLSVPEGAANGHADLGWQKLTGEVLARLDDQPRALILWGAPAQRLAAPLKHPGHLRLASPHPSPLAAYRGFFGSRPFSKVNHWLAASGRPTIDWVGRPDVPDQLSLL